MSRTPIAITAGVHKAKRFPVSVKRKVGQPAGRPAGKNRLTANEKAYADAVELAWTMIPAKLIQEQFLAADPGKILGGVVDALTPYEPFLAELTLFQVDQSGIVVFNEIKLQVAADWRTLEKATPSQNALAMNFNTASPAATQYANMSAGNMTQDMVQSQVQSVRAVIGRSFNDGLTRQQTSRNLVQVLNDIPTPAGVRPGNYALSVMFGDATKGLTTRYATAVYNRADKLIKQNPKMSAAELKRRSDRYGAKLRRSRARTIARTEIMRASNQGRLLGMLDAADRGLVDPVAAKKQWVTSRFDVCPICVPLNGRTVGLKESFGSPGQAPPAHPNCRCTIRMLPDPLTYGLPTSTGTGQAGSPIQFVRPTRPGLKIQDVVGGPGVVGPGSRVAAVPEALAPIPRAGNISADFNIPTSKVAEQTVGVVIQTMDDAGYIVSQQLPAGPVQVRLLKQKSGKKAGEGGSFQPRGTKTKPRRPAAGATDEQIQEYRQKAQAWADEPFESVLTVRTGKDISVGRMQNVATHEIGHRLDKIVKADVVEVRGRPLRTEPQLQGNYSDKTINAVAEKMRARAVSTQNLRTAGTGDIVNADDVFQKLTISDLNDEFASEEMLNFFQAVGRSDALAELRNIAGQSKATQVWGKYATSPTEIWARAFNQWHTMKHGAAEAVEDMLSQISRPLWSEAAASGFKGSMEDLWYGFQWRADEFDELVAPHVEKVLKHLGILE